MSQFESEPMWIIDPLRLILFPASFPSAKTKKFPVWLLSKSLTGIEFGADKTIITSRETLYPYRLL
jgi:hypothetical protein